MRVGILGSGLMGSKLGTIFARAGHEVVFSYARSHEKLKRLARAAPNARAGTPAEVTAEADALLLAVHWSRMDDILKQADDLAGKVIVTCSLPMNDDNTGLVVAHTTSGAEELAKRLPQARVVCAFNTVPSEVLFGVYEARRNASRPSLVYCGDDESSKTVATQLIRDVGFDLWMLDPYGSPDTSSPSHCSSANWLTRGKTARSWLTSSSGLGHERPFKGQYEPWHAALTRHSVTTCQSLINGTASTSSLARLQAP